MVEARALWAATREEGNHMSTLIVYESLFGNTREIAEAVAEGARTADPAAEVTCVGLSTLGPNQVREARLLVVGGPTHMHGMTSGMTRRMGVQNERKAGHEDRIEETAEGPGVRDFLHELHKAPSGARAAAFDTRADVKMAGGAAPGIAKRLRRHGYELVGEPEGFVIEDTTGPLRDGELQRAREWGAALMLQPVH